MPLRCTVLLIAALAGAFTVGGMVIGIPYDASLLVATVNRKMFAKAGVGQRPPSGPTYDIYVVR